MRLDAVSREWILRGAHGVTSRNRLCVPLWSWVKAVCCVGSTSATAICRELGWDPDAPAHKPLPESKPTKELT